MKSRIAAWGVALAGLVGSGSAEALSIAMDPAGPVPIGQPQAFRIAKVEGAVGNVTFRWNFGDGTRTDPLPDLTTTHTYRAVGHYTVIVLATDDEQTTSASFVQTAHPPIASGSPRHASSILVDETRRRVWNVNPDSNSVSVIDAVSLERVREIPVGDEPHSLALAPDGTIWVVNQRSDEIIVLDPDTGTIASRIDLPYASQAVSVVFGPTGMAYVSLFATGKLVELDAASRRVTRSVALGPTPSGVSVSPDGRIFVTRFLSPADHGEVWVVSPATFTLVNTIDLAFDMGPDTESSGRGVPNYVASFVIAPDGTQAFVTAKKDNVARGPQRDGLESNSDNIVRALVCVIDLKTESEIVPRRIDIDNRSQPVSVAFSPIGDYAYILLMASNWIGIYDSYTSVQLGGIKDVGHAPDGLVLSSAGKLFVNAFLSREVIAYDMNPSIASLDQGPPSPLARVRTVDHEPLSEQVLLGKQVFFNAADSRMSRVGYMSCVTCHFGGISDGRVWDFTTRGEGLRNTKTLLGARGVAEGSVHWSANFDEIQDFERDIRESFEGTGFMPDDAFKARQSSSGAYDPHGPSAAGASKELDALAAYFATFDRVARSPFRNSDGSLTQEAREGRGIFERAGCPNCHSGPDLTDSAEGKLHDVGTLLPTSGKRLGAPLTGIDTPSLKGVWQSAPYLHDGRAASLSEIFTKYLTRDQMGTTSDLTQVELANLARYMLELDDVPETPSSEPPRESRSAFRCSIGFVATARDGARSGIGPRVMAWIVAGMAMIAFERRRSRRAHPCCDVATCKPNIRPRAFPS